MDINCDLGESYGHFKIGNDEAIMPFITSCNIACGFHGGDPSTIKRTIDLAKVYNVKIGAHPSYPDLAGFGRRTMVLSKKELFDALLYQISAVKGMVEVSGQKLHHVKPHGALYNDMAKDVELAEMVIAAVHLVDPNLILYGMAGKLWTGISELYGLPYYNEVFSDRNYTDDLFLVPRSQKNALIESLPERITHVKRMVKNDRVKTESGIIHSIQADTICIHGDDPLADVTAIAISKLLKE